MRKTSFIITTVIADLFILAVGIGTWLISDCGYNINGTTGCRVTLADKELTKRQFVTLVALVTIAALLVVTWFIKRAYQRRKSVK